MGKLNPCDACNSEIGCCGCVFNVCPSEFECVNYRCFLNVDGMCMANLCEECYARKGAADG